MQHENVSLILMEYILFLKFNGTDLIFIEFNANVHFH